MFLEEMDTQVELGAPPDCTETLGGVGGTVEIVCGVARNGVSERLAGRLLAVSAPGRLWRVGPWHDRPTTAPAEAAPSPSASAGDPPPVPARRARR